MARHGRDRIPALRDINGAARRNDQGRCVSRFRGERRSRGRSSYHFHALSFYRRNGTGKPSEGGDYRQNNQQQNENKPNAAQGFLQKLYSGPMLPGCDFSCQLRVVSAIPGSFTFPSPRKSPSSAQTFCNYMIIPPLVSDSCYWASASKSFRKYEWAVRRGWRVVCSDSQC